MNPPVEIEDFCGRGKCTLSAVSPQNRGDLRVTLSEAALEENVFQIAKSDLGSWSLRQRLRQSGLIVRTHRLSMDKWVWPPERQSHMLFDCCLCGKGCDRHIYWHNAP